MVAVTMASDFEAQENMQSTSRTIPHWMNHKLQSRLLGEISTTSDIQMTPPKWQKNEEELKSLLLKVKGENEKAGLKLNIQKTKIMAYDPLTSWQIDEETIETVRDFIFLGSKITADGDCSHNMKRHLLLGRKAVTNLDNILKSRHQFANKSPYSHSYDFSSRDVCM